MNKDQSHFKRLFQLYLENKISPAELKELFAYLNDSASDRMMLEKMQEEFSIAFQEDGKPCIDIDSSQDYEALTEEAKIIPFYKKRLFKVASAAAVLIFIATIGFKLLDNRNNNTEKGESPVANQHIIIPGGNKATLTLSNGEIMILDSSANGTIAKDGNATIIKTTDGEIIYNPANSYADIGKEIINTLTTPMGGQYQLVLSDGSKVWLNAASSIKFPSRFSGKERKVEISGEVYFEVAKNAAMPFKVKVNNDEEVEVLGTQFNIKAYHDEVNTKTTLIEGAVRLTSAENNMLLSPGQQAISDKKGSLQKNPNVNVQHEIAWKNGLFDFENETLPEIMRQLARWYKVELDYIGKPPAGHYVGSIKRASKITQVLEMLELAGDVKFSIADGKIKIKTN